MSAQSCMVLTRVWMEPHASFKFVNKICRICNVLPKGWKKEVVLPILLITNCGLLMVDHIHFQYNGIMYGIMLLSISDMFAQRYLWSAFWFSVLLNMKHIYLYLAPAYFIYLLRQHCIPGPLSLRTVLTSKALQNLIQLVVVVIGVFAISFGPFLSQMPQVLARLFPFKRGLCHAYWAPNIWALYNTADKAAAIVLLTLGEAQENATVAAMTGGLVQEISHAVLPNISPVATLLLTVLFTLPAMLKLFFLERDPVHFLRCLVLCGLTAFIFGWHVHEKAILLAIIPLSILSILEARDASTFLLLSITGHYSLFPLLFPAALTSIKVLLLLLYSAYSFYSLFKIHLSCANRYAFPLLNSLESLYVVGLSGIFLYENVVHRALGLDRKLPFLPLMLTSVYCALGVVYCWAKYYLYFFVRPGQTAMNKDKMK